MRWEHKLLFLAPQGCGAETEANVCISRRQLPQLAERASCDDMLTGNVSYVNKPKIGEYFLRCLPAWDDFQLDTLQ